LGVDFLGYKGPGAGNLEVFIDNNSQGIVSEANSGAQVHTQVIFNKTWTSRGRHVIKVVSQTADFVMVDGFRVYDVPGVTPTPTPSPKVSATPVPSPSPSATPKPTPTPTVQGPQVEVLVGIGKVGRSIISCDDGKTWIQNKSFNDNARCWLSGDPNNTECDHDNGSVFANNLAYADGYFVRNYGWGTPGTAQRSPDGVNWETIASSPETNILTSASVNSSGAQIMIISSTSRISNVGGKAAKDAWTNVSNPDTISHVRTGGYSPYGGGRWLQLGDAGMLVSSTNGATWANANLPSSCASTSNATIASSSTTIVKVSDSGTVCYSNNGGTSWTATAVSGSISSHVVWTGTQFAVMGFGNDGNMSIHRSSNGANWTTTRVNGISRRIGVLGMSSKGTYIAITDEWASAYSEQKFYWSSDGVNWSEANSYAKSHPMRVVKAGLVPSNTYCK